MDLFLDIVYWAVLAGMALSFAALTAIVVAIVRASYVLTREGVKRGFKRAEPSTATGAGGMAHYRRRRHRSTAGAT